jgi:predicted PurR-regulated permease PerM
MKRIEVMGGILTREMARHTEEEAANPLDDVGEEGPDAAPLRTPTPAPSARVEPVLVPRWVQMVLLPVGIAAAYLFLHAAGHILLLFIIAGLIALLLNPFVALVQKLRIPRGAAVGIVMVTVLSLLIGLGFLLANPVSDQISGLQNDVPGYVDDANAELADLQNWLDRNGVDLEIKQEGETALQTIGERITGGAGDVVSFTRDAVQILVEASLAVILIIVLSIYMMIYGDRIGAVARALVPPSDGTPDDDFPTRIQASLFGYVRGQVLFSLIMGTSAGLMLFFLGSVGIFPEGKTYAIAFGAWFGFAELIPYVGPAIGGFPPVVIAALSENPIDAVWLIIAFTILQQLEGHIVAPNVFGQALRINPILVIFALLMGGQLAGIVGAFIALPIAAILRETIVYLRRHTRFQSWDLVSESPPPPRSQARCPECGALVAADAAECPACGTELGDRDAAASAAAAAPG